MTKQMLKANTEEEAKEILMKWFEENNIDRKSVHVVKCDGLIWGKWVFNVLKPYGVFKVDFETGEVEDNYHTLEKK